MLVVRIIGKTAADREQHETVYICPYELSFSVETCIHCGVLGQIRSRHLALYVKALKTQSRQFDPRRIHTEISVKITAYAYTNPPINLSRCKYGGTCTPPF